MKRLKTLKTVWKLCWALIALPFAYAILICAVIGSGHQAAKDWADDNGLWFPG